MKTNIAGLIYFILFTILTIIGALVLIISLINLGRLSGIVDSRLFTLALIAIFAATLYLAFGIFGMVWASHIRKHKKWAWYVGVVLLPIGFIGSIVSIIAGNYTGYSVAQLCSSVIGIILGAFTFYALLNEKNLFLGQQQNINDSSQIPPTIAPQATL